MLRVLSRLGLVRGLVGGSRFWTTLGAFAVAARLLKRLAGGQPKVVYRGQVREGESLLISHGRRVRVRRAAP